MEHTITLTDARTALYAAFCSARTALKNAQRAQYAARHALPEGCEVCQDLVIWDSESVRTLRAGGEGASALNALAREYRRAYRAVRKARAMLADLRPLRMRWV